MTPTEEQTAIVEFARTSSANMIVKALAGAAKTSTLVLIAKATADIPTLALSFNTAIAKEMKERLPSNCESQTLNGCGHRAWGTTIGRRLVINKDKVYDLMQVEMGKLKGKEKSDAYELMAQTMKWVREGKSSGYVPDNSPFLDKVSPVLGDDDFFETLDEAPTDWQIDTLRSVSNASIRAGVNGECDFDDQILLPTIFHHARFAQYPHVILDESQDLSELNHRMLKKIAKMRLMAVGDECQAIYGFRGAYENSMDLLQETFSMTPFVLSISFRCPTKVVEEARWRAPHMRWPEWAREGTVRTLQRWSVSDISDGAAILCRNNAPLFAMAMRLLRNGRYPEIVGTDIGKALIKILEKIGYASMSRDDLLTAILVWRDEKLEKSRNKGAIMDQAECLRVFSEAGNTHEDAIAYAKAIFAQSGPIKLLTIHKSKGLEFDSVFILDRDLMDTTAKGGQDRNLLYVAQTRTKDSLTYIDSTRFMMRHEL